MDPMVADAIQDDIINTVGQFEPRIELLEVDVNDLQVIMLSMLLLTIE